MGNEQQFKDMVPTCRKAGVKVYVDAVINHMTGQGDTSYGGVHLHALRLPGALRPTANFHHKYAGDCPSASGGIEDFNNHQQVFNCELRRPGRPAHRHQRGPQHGWPATSTS